MWELLGMPVREECSSICVYIGDSRSFRSDRVTPLRSSYMSWTALPVRENCGYINAGIWGMRTLQSCRVTESYLFVPAVRGELVLRDLRRLLELLLWTNFNYSPIFRTRWWRFIMSSGTGSPTTEWAVRTPAVLEELPGIFRGFDLTLQSDCLYDVDKDIADVIGLRAIQAAAAVVKVMSIPNNRCVRVVIPNNNVVINGFYEIIIYDMADADAPDVPVSELGCLRLDGRRPFSHTWDVTRRT